MAKQYANKFKTDDKVDSVFIVKNKHLGYESYLKKLFGECKTIAGNTKYEILKAVKIK